LEQRARLGNMSATELRQVSHLALMEAEARGSLESLAAAGTPIYNYPGFTFPGLVEFLCGGYAKAKWPSYSFFAGQLHKRLENYFPRYGGDDDVPPNGRKRGTGGEIGEMWYSSPKTKNWIDIATKVGCGYDYDPRIGSSSRQPETVKYLETIRNLPLEADWPEPPYTDRFFPATPCIDWFKQNMCYVMAWVEELTGHSHDDELCWDKVDFPLQKDNFLLFLFPAQIQPGGDSLKKCMDKPLTDVALRGICPMGGYAPPGKEEFVKECRRRIASEYEPPLSPEALSHPLGLAGVMQGLSKPKVTTEDLLIYKFLNMTRGPAYVEEVAGMPYEQILHDERALWNGRPYEVKSSAVKPEYQAPEAYANPLRN